MQMVGRVHLTRQISLDELKGQCRGEKDSKIKEASNIAKRSRPLDREVGKGMEGERVRGLIPR